jgi:reactive intermediate/imine deaminase
MSRQTIHTNRAPQAIGTYTQAVRAGDTVYLSGQIPLDPATMQLVTGDIEAEIRQVFENLKAVAEAAGGSLANAVKVNVYLTDLAHFATVNEVMAAYCPQPFPARAAVGVAQLPRGARVEIECVLYLG